MCDVEYQVIHVSEGCLTVVCFSGSFCKVIMHVAPHGHGYTLKEHPHVLAEDFLNENY